MKNEFEYVQQVDEALDTRTNGTLRHRYHITALSITEIDAIIYQGRVDGLSPDQTVEKLLYEAHQQTGG